MMQSLFFSSYEHFVGKRQQNKRSPHLAKVLATNLKLTKAVLPQRCSHVEDTLYSHVAIIDHLGHLLGSSLNIPSRCCISTDGILVRHLVLRCVFQLLR